MSTIHVASPAVQTTEALDIQRNFSIKTHQLMPLSSVIR